MQERKLSDDDVFHLAFSVCGLCLDQRIWIRLDDCAEHGIEFGDLFEIQLDELR